MYTSLFMTIISIIVLPCIILIPSNAYTVPEEVRALEFIKDANINRSINWQRALASWTCPTDADDSDEGCDPCSRDWSGNWEHIQCRGAGGRYGEGSIGHYDGYVTTVHVTDAHLDGPPAKEWCLLTHLRELDLDGGNQNGPFPEWIPKCHPQLQELDLSFNRLTGRIPNNIRKKETLQEFKVEHNYFSGPVPAILGGMPNLWRVRLAYNHFEGTIPESWRNMSGNLNQLDISHNHISGNLSVLAFFKLMYASVHSNAGLCGMVPESIRYASGYNPSGTGLGHPC
ncbi:hypothetical protein CEUSTIGMA_g404.t1 [Chlamydomonas eustigma]|uniref:Leucine-rich repeat-containing N-terminal plant-type domain-containing protein n=1 Tax=Chlamydomonas eustigma TaxID=1157962 RepID=A0A250WQI1_9CHLO|nr:hypothetical protein CEUSTIGMA_g404.t1 [Chlamydomonas eustigma]|eukprot:GAX72949.1 hypothetical protein CEUSTIGMA_g404.t1 [Chlamydomonas eustigma]